MQDCLFSSSIQRRISSSKQRMFPPKQVCPATGGVGYTSDEYSGCDERHRQWEGRKTVCVFMMCMCQSESIQLEMFEWQCWVQRSDYSENGRRAFPPLKSDNSYTAASLALQHIIAKGWQNTRMLKKNCKLWVCSPLKQIVCSSLSTCTKLWAFCALFSQTDSYTCGLNLLEQYDIFIFYFFF